MGAPGKNPTVVASFYTPLRIRVAMSEDATDDEIPSPGFVLPGLRAGLEMALVGIVIGLAGLPTQDTLVLALVLLSALLGMVVVLFWSMNRHMRRWVRYAQGKPTRGTIFD